MAAELIGYEGLLKADAASAAERLDDAKKLLNSVVPDHGGRELHAEGASVTFVFDKAIDGVRCSYAAQEVMEMRNAGVSDKEMIALKVGVHIGYGLDDVEKVARKVCGLADASGVCISDSTYNLLGDQSGFNFAKAESVASESGSPALLTYRIVFPWTVATPEPETPALSRTRVAVLPLRNISPDPKDEYFADGLTEELISTLSKISGLSVISRSSVIKYKTTEKTIPEIGKELNVGMVLDGSVRKDGNRMRTALQLIDASKDDHVWAQSYDAFLVDVFAVQSDVAEKVASTLKVKLLSSEKRDIKKRATEDMEAYTLYLRGRFFWNQRSDEGMLRALEYFKKATERDPTYALGYAGLADCHFLIAANNMGEAHSNYAEAREYVTKALQLDGQLAEAHATFASILADVDFDFDRAEQMFKKAVMLEPSYATGHFWFAIHLRNMGRWDEARIEMKKAMELDPLSSIIRANYAECLYFNKDYDGAIRELKSVIEVDPLFGPAHENLLAAYLQKGMFHEALKEVDALVDCYKGRKPITIKMYLASVYAHMGRKEEARKLLTQAEDKAGDENLTYFEVAGPYFAMGDVEKGFELLERSFVARERYLSLVRLAIELDGVRSDPRYLSLIERIGLA